MNNVTNWTVSVWHGFTAGLDRFMAGIPTVLGALAILILGWIIAGILASVAARFFRAIHTDRLADRIGVNEFLHRSGARLRASDVLADVIKWVVRLIFIEMATDQLGLVQVTAVVNHILYFIPNILVALVVLGVGAFLAQLAGTVVRGAASEAGFGNPDMPARLARVAIMAFAIIAAMNQLDISPIVVNTLYIGLVAAISLALGLAFGLGGRETAARLTERWVGKLENTTAQLQQSQQSSTQPVPPVQSATGSVGVYDSPEYRPRTR